MILKAVEASSPDLRRRLLFLLAERLGIGTVAELMGRSRSTVSRYIAGRSDPPPRLVARVLESTGFWEEPEIQGMLAYDILSRCLDVLGMVMDQALSSRMGREVEEEAAKMLCLLSRHLGVREPGCQGVEDYKRYACSHDVGC